MFSREDFDTACQTYVSARPTDRGNCGWQWNAYSSPYQASVGYLARITTEFTLDEPSEPFANDDMEALSDGDGPVTGSRDEVVAELEDEAAAPRSTTKQPLNCQQYVVYAPGFQVPAFYFTLHDARGSPLRVDDLIRTSLFRPSAFDATTRNSFAITPSASAFPLLSQGDHPVLGTPCWYIHPCETATALNEIMSEMRYDDGGSRERRLKRTLEAWFMLLSSIVNLQHGTKTP
ncbi:hypothetical protein EV121DRAFT_253348 [Schizophyllum commune]